MLKSLFDGTRVNVLECHAGMLVLDVNGERVHVFASVDFEGFGRLDFYIGENLLSDDEKFVLEDYEDYIM